MLVSCGERADSQNHRHLLLVNTPVECNPLVGHNLIISELAQWFLGGTVIYLCNFYSLSELKLYISSQDTDDDGTLPRVLWSCRW